VANTATDGGSVESPAPRTLLRRRPIVGGVEILGGRLARELARSTGDDESVRLCLRGDLGHALACLDDRLVVLKAGFHAGTTFGSMSATMYYRDVTGIQVRTHLLSGWIEISSPSFQGSDAKRTRMVGPSSRERDVYKLPNCVPIQRRHAAAYVEPLGELRRLISLAKLEARDAGVVDELERLAALRREGLLDGDEFAAAKARVFGAPLSSVQPTSASASEERASSSHRAA
jgi:hypothetical protein